MLGSTNSIWDKKERASRVRDSTILALHGGEHRRHPGSDLPLDLRIVPRQVPCQVTRHMSYSLSKTAYKAYKLGGRYHNADARLD